MRRMFALFACTLVSSTLLAGCGQKGPLYMPDDEASRERYDPTNEYGDQQQRDEQQQSQQQDNRQTPSSGEGVGTEPGEDVPPTPGDSDAVNLTPGGATSTHSAPGSIPTTTSTE
ncbi:LPS translocon maturation chaperone LptM [Phytohalomonas tamaricis]|uniref:LPS translocon maturation chaperone LptM n=1 Tax=Phytohalomonas tamaricis TaxID=2081032 RepID=UPI000D0B03C9